MAEIKCSVLFTERQNHARDMVEALTPDQMREIDGLVAVGGDGLFQARPLPPAPCLLPLSLLPGCPCPLPPPPITVSCPPFGLPLPFLQEILNGLITVRGKDELHNRFAKRIRLGHIPAGSTDALAFTVHGTRSVLAATLHIALGDRLPLDVMRVDAIGEGKEGQAS